MERVQLTILGERWRPAFSRSLAPRITALRRDLDEYLRYYNANRAHTGRLTKGGVPKGGVPKGGVPKGGVPADIVFGARKMASVR